MSERNWPCNVGILDMEVYFPPYYVDQSELERFDGVSTGKYTVGLGQSQMGVCSDREDIYSLCLTVVHRLMSRTGLQYSEIGRLEVGTETLIDKSKSVKTVLMQLFGEDTNVEGVDNVNACYGGTNALFNTVQWIESSYWDGRYGLVVAGDIAIYASGSARPTGGAGAVAMLIGVDAPIVLERGLRSTHMKHVYDFYKPDMSSEYPVVDGPLSVTSYLAALDTTYRRYKEAAFSLDSSDIHMRESNMYIIFHTPYCKLIRKSVARLLLNDFVADQVRDIKRCDWSENLNQYKQLQLETTYGDKEVERSFIAESTELYETRVKPSLTLANRIGNMYTPSLYACLISLLVQQPTDCLLGNRVLLFSYGSGLASSMFSLRFATDSGIVSRLRGSLDGVLVALDSRIKLSPQEYVDMMLHREKTHHLAPFQPMGSVDDIPPLTYYLTHTDSKHRRYYATTSPIANDKGDLK